VFAHFSNRHRLLLFPVLVGPFLKIKSFFESLRSRFYRRSDVSIFPAGHCIASDGFFAVTFRRVTRRRIDTHSSPRPLLPTQIFLVVGLAPPFVLRFFFLDVLPPLWKARLCCVRRSIPLSSRDGEPYELLRTPPLLRR